MCILGSNLLAGSAELTLTYVLYEGFGQAQEDVSYSGSYNVPIFLFLWLLLWLRSIDQMKLHVGASAGHLPKV